MPTYAYRCPKCGHEFHRFRKMSVRARPKFPECGATAEQTITGGAGLTVSAAALHADNVTVILTTSGQTAAQQKAFEESTEAQPMVTMPAMQPRQVLPFSQLSPYAKGRQRKVY